MSLWGQKNEEQPKLAGPEKENSAAIFILLLPYLHLYPTKNPSLNHLNASLDFKQGLFCFVLQKSGLLGLSLQQFTKHIHSTVK